MSIPVIARTTANLTYSLHKWVREQQYKITEDGDPGTLLSFYDTLVVVPAYPNDLQALRQSTLAICCPDSTREGRTFYGFTATEDVYRVAIYGFVAGFGNDNGRALLYRDTLMNDVYQLIRVIGESEGVALYDASTEEALGTFEFSSVRKRVIPANAPAIEADRYKFVVEAEIEYV